MITTRVAQDADLQSMADLMLVCRAAGVEDDWPPVAELRELYAVLDPARDIRLWEAGGELVGWALLYMPWCNLTWYVQPQNRGAAIEAEIVAWAAARVRAHNRDTGDRHTLDAAVREDDRYRAAVLEHHGFILQEDQVLSMARSLDEPILEPQLPEGFVLRPLAGEAEVAAYVTLHRAAFGTENMTVERRLAIVRNQGYIPKLDLVAEAPDGTLAAFCVCSIEAEENAGRGLRRGAIDIIGSRPDWRGRGLGRAMLLAGLRALRAHGMAVATLGTGSDKIAGQRLYESAGFRIAYRKQWYTKCVMT